MDKKEKKTTRRDFLYTATYTDEYVYLLTNMSYLLSYLYDY